MPKRKRHVPTKLEKFIERKRKEVEKKKPGDPPGAERAYRLSKNVVKSDIRLLKEHMKSKDYREVYEEANEAASHAMAATKDAGRLPYPRSVKEIDKMMKWAHELHEISDKAEGKIKRRPYLRRA